MARRSGACRGRTIRVDCVMEFHTASLGMDRKWYVFFAWITRGDYRIQTDSDDAHFRGSDHRRNLVVYAEFPDGAAYMELYRARTQVEDHRDLVCRLAIG